MSDVGIFTRKDVAMGDLSRRLRVVCHVGCRGEGEREHVDPTHTLPA